MFLNLPENSFFPRIDQIINLASPKLCLTLMVSIPDDGPNELSQDGH